MTGKVFYTTLTRNQVGVLYAANANGSIHMTKNMADYLYQLARQGGGVNYNAVEEKFRIKIVECVNLVFQHREKEADEKLREAFQYICACWDSNSLRKIRKDLENRELYYL